MRDPGRLPVVFDTNVVLSALVFANGRLAWLRRHWREGQSVPLVSKATVAELQRVLGYPRLKLSREYQIELLSDYLCYCEIVAAVESCPLQCRDSQDQPFLDLAHSGKAKILVTGDADLLALAGQSAFQIETPEVYRQRFSAAE